MRLFRRLGLLLVTTLLCVAPAWAAPHVYVRIAPPAPIVEVRPSAPRPGYVWHDGHFRWNGHRYVWMRGRWTRAPYRNARWTSGRWSHAHRGWHWVPGHWSRS